MTNPWSDPNVRIFQPRLRFYLNNNESRGNIRAKYLLYGSVQGFETLPFLLSLRASVAGIRMENLKFAPTPRDLFLQPVLRRALNSGRNGVNFFVCFRRWKVLQVAVDERYKLLSGFGKDGSTPGSQAFLASSVEPPWERALTPAKVPYYIK